MYVIFPYIYHKNQRNVGKYTIHGSYGYGLSRCESKTEDFGPKGSRASSGQEPGSTSSVGKRFVKKWFPGRATLKDTNTWFVVLFFDIGKKNDIYIYIYTIYLYIYFMFDVWWSTTCVWDVFCFFMLQHSWFSLKDLSVRTCKRKLQLRKAGVDLRWRTTCLVYIPMFSMGLVNLPIKLGSLGQGKQRV